MESGVSISNFPCSRARAFLTVNGTDRRGGGQELTEGEEEGIKANLAAWWNLRDEPLCYTADGN